MAVRDSAVVKERLRHIASLVTMNGPETTARYIVILENTEHRYMNLVRGVRSLIKDLDHASDVPGVHARCGVDCDRCKLEELVDGGPGENKNPS